MWFYPILALLVVLGIAGGIFMGGVFTLILVPLVVVVMVSLVGYAMWARSQAPAGAGAEAGAEGAAGEPLPHHHERPPRRVTTTPERLVEGRAQQSQVPDS
jgi:hypothetical protein